MKPIDTMPAGREMDAFIAEKVMGLNVVAKDWPCYHCPECGEWEARSARSTNGAVSDGTTPDYVYEASPDGWPPKPYDAGREFGIEEEWAIVNAVPAYSTDIAAAWQVEERIHKLGLDEKYGDALTLLVLLSKGMSECDAYIRMGRGLYGDQNAAIAHASPLLRCRAALKAAYPNQEDINANVGRDS